jgi:Cysteine rich repeat
MRKIAIQALIGGLTALSIALATPAVAADQNQTGTGQARAALNTACHADYERLCSDVQPGGGRIIACMKAHKSDLSADCKAGLAAAAQARSR